MLFGLDVKSFFESAGYKQMLAGEFPGLGQTLTPEQAEQLKKELQTNIEKGLAEGEAKVGIRFDRDVSRMVIAVADVSAKEPRFALMAFGTFDQAKVTSALTATLQAEGETLTPKTVEGTSVLVVTEKTKPTAALAFLDDKTLLAGQPEVVEAILGSRARREQPLAANASLTALVRGLDPTSGYWLVLDEPVVSRLEKESPAASPVPLPRTLTWAGKFDGGFEIAGQMADASAAKNLADMIQGGLATIRVQAAANPEIQKVPGAKELLETIEVKSEEAKVTLSIPTGGAGGAGLSGVVAAIAIPSLLRARVSANESAAIGDLRTVISAQAAYQSANAGYYGELSCLAEPKLCIVGYQGPTFLDKELASGQDKSGYRRAFHAGPAGPSARSLVSYAYAVSPVQQGQTGVRSFCGDASGLICVDPTGADFEPVSGACPAGCSPLQ